MPGSSLGNSHDEQIAATTPFRDALDKIDGALALHYSTGDYVPLGMVLQDNAAEIMRALRLAATMEETLRG